MATLVWPLRTTRLTCRGMHWLAVQNPKHGASPQCSSRGSPTSTPIQLVSSLVMVRPACGGNSQYRSPLDRRRHRHLAPTRHRISYRQFSLECQLPGPWAPKAWGFAAPNGLRDKTFGDASGSVTALPRVIGCCVSRPAGDIAVQPRLTSSFDTPTFCQSSPAILVNLHCVSTHLFFYWQFTAASCIVAQGISLQDHLFVWPFSIYLQPCPRGIRREPRR
jgi:hypothetical protein